MFYKLAAFAINPLMDCYQTENFVFVCFPGSYPSYIFLSGLIVDGGTDYNITGLVIGEFDQKKE